MWGCHRRLHCVSTGIRICNLVSILATLAGLNFGFRPCLRGPEGEWHCGTVLLGVMGLDGTPEPSIRFTTQAAFVCPFKQECRIMLRFTRWVEDDLDVWIPTHPHNLALASSRNLYIRPKLRAGEILGRIIKGTTFNHPDAFWGTKVAVFAAVAQLVALVGALGRGHEDSGGISFTIIIVYNSLGLVFAVTAAVLGWAWSLGRAWAETSSMDHFLHPLERYPGLAIFVTGWQVASAAAITSAVLFGSDIILTVIASRSKPEEDLESQGASGRPTRALSAEETAEKLDSSPFASTRPATPASSRPNSADALAKTPSSSRPSSGDHQTSVAQHSVLAQRTEDDQPSRKMAKTEPLKWSEDDSSTD